MNLSQVRIISAPVMAQNATTPAATTREKTFSAYNDNQGKAYSQIRRNYHPSVYQTVLDHHQSTGGQLHTLLDVGCGPGFATQSLAPHFEHATGLDPSAGMISTARSLGGTTASSEPIRYEVSTAEELGSSLAAPVQDGTVDLVTAANAAHWFDMAPFWRRAARLLKPGGSVALWIGGGIRVHPSVPNSAAIQTAIEHNFEQHLKPYTEPGNLLARNRYADLLLPWTMQDPVPEFDPASFLRKEWDADQPFYAGEQEADLDTFEKMMGTGSAVTRWRQAHPDSVGTEHDVVRMLRRDVERLLREAGVEGGKERLKGSPQGVVLIVKKKA